MSKAFLTRSVRFSASHRYFRPEWSEERFGHGAVPEDSSGFNFKTKFHVGPTVGLRIHPSPRFHIRIEGRATLWKLKYPDLFFNDPTNAPGTDPLLDPILETDSDWTIHPTLLFGIGYTLRR